ncbi:MAG: MazG nucleotide pyrophosphohydrolase domain-containing protein, partial [Ruthenibacterium lactatiformans]
EEEQGAFTFGDVCTGICKKLIYRHPHIFGDAGAQTPDEALQNWEALKRREKHREGAGDDLDSVPAALPALMRSRKVAKRAADHGFTYPDAQAAIADLEQELTELKQAVAQGSADAQQEVGDVLFSAANVSLSGLRRGRGAGRRNGEICAALQGNGTPGRPAGLRGG